MATKKSATKLTEDKFEVWEQSLLCFESEDGSRRNELLKFHRKTSLWCAHFYFSRSRDALKMRRVVNTLIAENTLLDSVAVEK